MTQQQTNPEAVTIDGYTQPGSSPNAYIPYEAALSEEPCPTMRIVVAPRSRIVVATRSNASAPSSRRARASGCSRISAR